LPEFPHQRQQIKSKDANLETRGFFEVGKTVQRTLKNLCSEKSGRRMSVEMPQEKKELLFLATKAGTALKPKRTCRLFFKGIQRRSLLVGGIGGKSELGG
jgi:hypothetical protein